MNFEDLIAKVKTCGKQKLAVAAAEDDAVLEAVDAAHKQGIADAILVGDETAIRKIAAELNIDLSDYEIINEPDKVQASLKAVKLAHDGVANMYMKGLLDTKTFLKSVLDKEVGLRTGNTLSHVAVFEVKGIEQLLFLTDVAFMTYPTLEDKVHIIENTVAVAHACGVACPKVAPLAAVEVVNPKMPCTVDAEELRKMNEEGKITGCVVDGPLSMDIAIDPEAAHHKGAQDRPAAGHADILLFPDIQAGNLVYKTLVHTADCKNGCILTGTKVPAILTSRSDSFQTKVNSIALAATANNAKIVDEAMADDYPVSPKTKTVYMIALLMGIGIPVAVIYVMGLLQFRIEGRTDVEKLTSVPIIGDIPLAEEGDGKQGSIAVRENENDLMAETFRGIRTNLQFMLGEENKVVLVTSTISGEGKTFVATNLAISLSLLGKKVVIVGLDIRKPGLNKVFSLSHKEKGITQYLANPQHTDLLSMVQPSEISPNLSILPGGTVPPNPTELLARQALVQAIDILKRHFDYVILDTAPIGLVTDTQIIARVADLSVYVCRADYTHKADYTLLEDLRLGNKLPNLCTVINGLDMKKRKYGYYYGYGKYGRYYGYGKKYGYGYGYGQKHT